MRQQAGFSLVIVLFVMIVGTAVALSAYSAVAGDINVGQENVDDKRATAAAEAGLADYLQKLASDNEYWLKCTNVPALGSGAAAPVNQQWNGSGSDPRIWRTLPSDPQAKYTIELIPVTGYSTCQQNVDASMMDSSGTIRIRTTGSVGIANGRRKRSLVTTLRRNGFLDFLYFTDFETSDPSQHELFTDGNPVKRCAPSATCAQDDIAAWAALPSACAQYVRDGRNSVSYPGSIQLSGSWRTPSPPLTCPQIQFLGTDSLLGPVHTNDTISICGQPKLGRNRTGSTSAPIDRVEYYDYNQTCSGGGPDNGNNRVTTGSALQILQLPQSNSQLLKYVQSNYLFQGQTTIALNGANMTVTSGGTTRTLALPSNGVVYIANSSGGSCPRWSALYPYASGQSACGDVWLSGTYSQSLTIAAARDVIVTGNITGSNNALLGLIANNFVRMYHPVASYPCTATTANSQSGTQSRRIEAAMLSLGHVLTVDNYECGAALGTLTIYGAIAQRFRGAVGQHSGGSIVHGYAKDYQYDDRLRFRSPPYFLSPVQSSWRIVRSTEQIPPR